MPRRSAPPPRPPTGSPDDPVDARRAAYFQEAALLRWCLQLNKEDFDFAAKGGRIIYVVDANVVRFFVGPEQESDHVTPFRSPRRTLDYAAGTAVITAEYLFSRNLTGQQSAPCFIAPAHGEEIGGIIRDIHALRQNAAPDDPPLTAGKLEELRAVVDGFVEGRIHRNTAAERLRSVVPQLAELLIGHFQWAVQLKRLYDLDLMRPLALHTEATREILYPDRDRVQDWADRLRDEWGRHDAEKPSRHGHDRERAEQAKRPARIRTDAEVLTQTMLLDEAIVEAGDDAAARYVLITADTHLLDAYVRWYWSADRRPHQRFVLRLPLQYAPILNSLEMPNGLSMPQLTERATVALDSLFENLQRTDAEFVTKLPWYRIQARGGVAEHLVAIYGVNPLRPSAATEEALQRVKALWHDSFRTGVVLNANLLNSRNMEFKILAALLKEDVDIREAIYRHQEQSLDEIARAHARFTTRLNVAMLQRGVEFRSARRTMLPVRSMFSVGGGLSLDAIVRGIVAGNAGLAAEVDDLLARESSEAYFLAGCIAHRCGHWNAARIYASRALELMASEAGPDDPDGEVACLLASATRYACAAEMLGQDRAGAMETALRRLNEAERACEVAGDQFGMVRARSERCTLAVLGVFQRWLASPDAPADPGLGSLQADLGFCLKLLQDADIQHPSLRDLVYRQTQANILSTALFVEALAPPGDADAKAIGRFPPALIRDALLTFQSPAPSVEAAPLQALCDMVQFAQGGLLRDDVLARLKSAEAAVENDPSALPMDRLIVQRLASLVELGRIEPGPAAWATMPAPEPTWPSVQ